MLASGLVTFFFVALVAVNVVGHPVPLPIQRALAKRGPAPFEPILAYVNRNAVDRGIVKRQDTNTIPEEVPTKAPNGVTEAYVKRQDTNSIPEEVPTKAPNGVIEAYVKRQGTNSIPEEVPTKAPNGVTVLYVKRQDINDIP